MSDIRYSVEVDTRSGTTNLNQLKQQVSGVTAGFGNLRGAIAAIAGAFAINEVNQFVRSITSATSTFERYQTVLTTFLGSQSAANRELARLQDLANTLPQDLADVTEAFVIFTRFGLETSSEAITNFSNIATASGKSLEQLGEALGDALTGEFERLKEFGIRISRENGIIQARIGDDIVATATSANQLVRQLQELGNTRFGGAAAANANTLSQSMSNLRGAVFETQIQIGEGLKPALIEINNQFAEFLRANQELAREIGVGLGGALTALSEVALFAAENIDTLKNIILSLVTIKLVTFLSNTVGELSKLTGGARSVREAFSGLPRVFGAVGAGAGIFRSIGVAIRALTGPVGLAVAAIVGLNKVISDAFDVDIISGFAGALVDVAQSALNSIFETFRDIAAVYDRLVGNENIRNLSFNELRESGRDTVEVIEELERRLNSLVGPEWFQNLTMTEASERLRDEMQDYVNAARQRMFADEMMRLAEESAAEAAVERARIFREQLAPFQDYINKATEYAAIDFSTPIEAATARFELAQETIEGLNAALENSSRAAIPNFNELMAAAQNELEAARIEMERLAEVGTFRGFFRNLIEQSEAAVQEAQFLQWALEDLDEAFRNGVISQDVYTEAVNRVNSALGITTESADRARQALESALEGSGDFINRLNESTADARFELEALNMNPLERQIADITRGLNRDLQREIDRLNRALEDGADPTAIQNEINRITQATQQAIREQSEFARQSREHQRSFAYGWSQAFEEYRDNATNAAQRARDIFTRVTRGMEDSIVGFVKTGKFEWRNFVADILESMLRANLQNIFANVFGGIGGGNRGGSQTGGGGLFGGFFATGGMIPPNRFGIVGENGREIVSGPATVTPMSDLVNSVVYNINAVDARSFKELVAADPSFIYAVSQQGARSIPGRRV
jgi:hypothetical protein